MFKRFALVAALFAFAGLLSTYAVSSTISTAQAVIIAQALPPVFSTESAAQAHCPKDVVVWLNIPSGIYHYRPSAGMGARSTVPTHVRKRRSQPAIARARMAIGAGATEKRPAVAT